MKSWAHPNLPAIEVETLPLKIFSTSAQSIVEIPLKDYYQMYVCGITPYDATHLGHAATYLTFDIVHRYWRALGAEVNYIQNITDIDDPLLERAKRDGRDWRELAHSQIDLFRGDMTKLRIIPPKHYEGAVEAIPDVAKAIESLASKGMVYKVDQDQYLEIHRDPKFGSESHLSEHDMLKIFAERGGDPNRVGKIHKLDPLLWLNERPGEPAWQTSLGNGRPGWHIECAAIALKFATWTQTDSIEDSVEDSVKDSIIDVQGGGSDLIFPHHEMSASQVHLLTGRNFAHAYVHAALIGLDGEKMSKSKGNLVFVSKLIEKGIDPMAIRWALLKRHYREEYMWQNNETDLANAELALLHRALIADQIPSTVELEREIWAAIGNDLDTPKAISAINNWAKSEGSGGNPERLRQAIDALLGIVLPA